MENKKVIVITGMSGAGKTTAMSIFEDMGYLCIDNFPHSLLKELYKLIEIDDTEFYNKVVLGINIMDFSRFLSSEAYDILDPQVFMLTASSEELLKRYKYNRRVHPLVKQEKARSEVDAIQIEYKEMNRLVGHGETIIDTTYLNKRQLIQQIERRTELSFRFNAAIVFTSFGYRHGIPLDADYIFDVRFLDNPYWKETLREKTGLDQEVIDAVLGDSKSDNFLHRLVSLLDVVIDGVLNMDRSTVTIAIGCTGGQHRSVVIAQYLANHYSSKRFESIMNPHEEHRTLNIMINHRDVEKNLVSVLNETKERKE